VLRQLERVLKVLSLLFYVVAAQAADPVLPKTPTDEELELLKNSPLLQKPTQEQLKNAPGVKMPTDEELKNVQIPKVPDLQGLDLKSPVIMAPGLVPLLQSQPKTNLNPADIMNVYKDMQPQPQLLAQGHIYIFVSFSMPKTSLNSLAREAERVGGTLVIRGLHENSMRKTSLKIQEVIGDSKAGWQIDPPAFTRYEVDIVPAFVLLKAGSGLTRCKDGKCEKAPIEYAMVVGDVPMEYAMEVIGKQKPGFHTEADYFLGKLRNHQ
jgi:conjugal transfer pilus assembly protein TrbC